MSLFPASHESKNIKLYVCSEDLKEQWLILYPGVISLMSTRAFIIRFPNTHKIPTDSFSSFSRFSGEYVFFFFHFLRFLKHFAITASRFSSLCATFFMVFLCNSWTGNHTNFLRQIIYKKVIDIMNGLGLMPSVIKPTAVTMLYDFKQLNPQLCSGNLHF